MALNRTRNLRGPCQHCRGLIEYPAQLVGTTTQCPHCRQTTELLLATPPLEPAVPRRVIGWTIAAIIILVLGLVGSFIALKRAQNWAERYKPKTPPAAAPAQP